ncbi:MAG: D-aminoacyl-tRNA deacylase [Pseudomonadales bacterium]
MRVLLQRVSEASVSVAGERIAGIGVGLLLLVGIEPQDGAAEIAWMTDKVLGLRIFSDAEGHMNRSVIDVGGELLVVSQFTLAADTSRGRRPGFSTAAPPELAQRCYEDFVARLRGRLTAGGHAPARVQTGRFGADMQVALINDGPVTFLLEKRAD